MGRVRRMRRDRISTSAARSAFAKATADESESAPYRVASCVALPFVPWRNCRGVTHFTSWNTRVK